MKDHYFVVKIWRLKLSIETNGKRSWGWRVGRCLCQVSPPDFRFRSGFSLRLGWVLITLEGWGQEVTEIR